jgi:hypothetical protein
MYYRLYILPARTSFSPGIFAPEPMFRFYEKAEKSKAKSK